MMYKNNIERIDLRNNKSVISGKLQNYRLFCMNIGMYLNIQAFTEGVVVIQ